MLVLTRAAFAADDERRRVRVEYERVAGSV